MSDEIEIAYRSRDDTPLDAAAAAHRLDPEARAVAREILAGAAREGVGTVGEVVDRLEAASPSERLEIADRARAAAGLETVSERRSRIAFEMAQPPPEAPRDKHGQVQPCHHRGCGNISSNPDGTLRGVPDARWFCPKHQDEASEADRKPPPVWKVSAKNGRPIPPPEVRAEMDAKEAKRQERFRREVEQRRADGERLAKLEAEHRAKVPLPANLAPPKSRKREGR